MKVNTQIKIRLFSITVLLMFYISPAMCDSYWAQTSAQTDVYGTRSQEPTCCYSGSRLWQDTNSQSGWSANRSGFDPYGISQHSDYLSTRPTPLPRDASQGNPWSVGGAGFGRERRREKRIDGPLPTAQYFQPAYNNFAPPVAPDMGGWENDLMLLGYGPLGDPYLSGLLYPGFGLAPFAYPAYPWLLGPFVPGYTPGIWW